MCVPATPYTQTNNQKLQNICIRHRNIKTDVEEVRWEGVDWTCSGPRSAVNCYEQCNEPMVPHNVGNSFSCRGSVSFLRRTLLHGIGWLVGYLFNQLVSQNFNIIICYEILGSYSTDYEEYCHLGNNALIFQKNVLPPSAGQTGT